MSDIVVLALAGSSVLGGVETYVLRMMRWLREQQIELYLMHEKDAVFAPAFSKAYQAFQPKEILLNNHRDDVQINLASATFVRFPSGSKVHIICFQNPFLLFAAETIKQENPACHIDTIFYVTHYLDFQRNKANRSSNSILRGLLKRVYRDLLEQLQLGGNIVYMDEYCAEQINTNYGLDWKAFNPEMVRLGIELRPFDENKAAERWQENSILTIARFEFPYKGYVAGLLDEFEKFAADHACAVLHIIGDGEGKKLLEEKIARISEELRSRIVLHGAVPYEQLQPYFGHAKLYIGMGTTLLDASNEGVLPVMAKCDQMSCQCGGLFYEHITDVAYAGEIPAAEIMERVQSMSMSAYTDACRANYTAFAQTYDINTVMRQLLEHRNRTERATLSRLTLWCLNAGRRLLVFASKLRGSITKISG